MLTHEDLYDKISEVQVYMQVYVACQYIVMETAVIFLLGQIL